MKWLTGRVELAQDHSDVAQPWLAAAIAAQRSYGGLYNDPVIVESDYVRALQGNGRHDEAMEQLRWAAGAGPPKPSGLFLGTTEELWTAAMKSLQWDFQVRNVRDLLDVGEEK